MMMMMIMIVMMIVIMIMMIVMVIMIMVTLTLFLNRPVMPLKASGIAYSKVNAYTFVSNSSSGDLANPGMLTSVPTDCIKN